MRPAPRRVWPAGGGGILDRSDRVSEILDIPRSCRAPGAVDTTHQQVMRFMRRRRADQSIDEYIVEYGLLCPKTGISAESKMEMGAGLTDQFIPKSGMDVAALCRHPRLQGGRYAQNVWIGRERQSTGRSMYRRGCGAPRARWELGCLGGVQGGGKNKGRIRNRRSSRGGRGQGGWWGIKWFLSQNGPA